MQKKEGQVTSNKNNSGKKFEYVLRLFITGATPNSTRALTNIKEICERISERPV